MDVQELETRLIDMDIVARAESSEFRRRIDDLESSLKKLADLRDIQVIRAEFDAYKREVVALVKSAVTDSKATEIARAISDRLSQTVLTVRLVGQESSRAPREERQSRVR
jgi:hypothetical protein